MSAANHIIVLQNGFNAHHWSMHSMAVPLREALSAADCAIVISDVNNMVVTYFGVELCGHRLRDFVKEQCRLHPFAAKISFIGSSMGGLMIRYCIGLLHEENFFGSDRSLQQMQPVMYVSVASPHLGVQASLGAFQQTLARWAIPRTGAALLLEDEGKLLLNMSLPDSAYMLGLKRFQLYAYGNLVGDNLVPMENACLCDSSAQLYAIGSDAAAAPVSVEAVAAGQLVRVEHVVATSGILLKLKNQTEILLHICQQAMPTHKAIPHPPSATTYAACHGTHTPSTCRAGLHLTAQSAIRAFSKP
jgi:hypothetical protein